MRVPVTRAFDSTDIIGYLQLRDGVEVPLHSVFSPAYLVEERGSDGKPKKWHIHSVILISDKEFAQYLENQKNPSTKREERGEGQRMTTLADIQASDWYTSRPPAVRRRIDAYPPNKLYRLKTTGQIVPLYAYEEDQQGECTTCKVHVLRCYNPHVMRDRMVFGVSFADLEVLSEEEASQYREQGA